MASNLLIVSSNVLSLFLMMAVGFVLAKIHWLSENTLSQISRILLNVVTPCILISSFQVAFSRDVLKAIGLSFLIFASAQVIFGILSTVFFHRPPAETRSVLRFGTMFGNVGFMGIPLVSAVLGSSALFYCTMNMVIFNIGCWTFGVALMGQRISLKRVLLNPGVIGFAIGFALFLCRVSLPAPVASAVDYLTALNTPLAMIVIGGQMASAKLLQTFRTGKLYGAAVLKLLAFPLITLTLLLILPLNLDPMLSLTLVVLSACPTAGTTAMFAQNFRQDTATAAQMVSLSTLLCIVSLPLITVLAQVLLG